MPIIKGTTVEVRDEGATQGRVHKLDFVGSGVSAAVVGDVATVTIAGGGGGSLTLTTSEVNIGTIPRKAGKFNITTTGLTSGKAVSIAQANGPYTTKGSRTDEAEMDHMAVSGKTTSTTNIECFWACSTLVKGNVKFDWVASA
jgi:predicted ThiF/HesA family dinucleotide-utilizing enzyme